MNHFLEIKNVTMRFGALLANDHVSITCSKGAVVSLLGENGAGKTTLMKVLYGMNKPELGEVFIEGNRVDIRSPKDAIRCGIQMVHQHFMLVDHLSVAENITLGKEPKKFGVYQRREAERYVTSFSRDYGLSVNPRALVGTLSVGEKQRVEIIKALYHGARLLILDEPTAVLTPQETLELFDIIRKLKADGKSVIFITHKLHETMEIADHVYVMRHGKVVGSVAKENTNPHELAYMMVDYVLKDFQRPQGRFKDVAVKIENLTLKSKNEDRNIIDGLSLSIRGGEVYGIVGIEGNGQMELIEILSGIKKGWRGRVEMLSRSIADKSVQDIIDMGVSSVHLDRHDRGLLLELNADENVILGYQDAKHLKTRYGFLRRRENQRITEQIFETYGVSPRNIRQPMKSFSGGNQQKLLVGREFYRKPRIALVAYPTRGVDICISDVIHNKIIELRREGSAVLLITADFEELFKLSDRIGVLYEGRIVHEGTSGSFTPEILGYHMGGGKDREEI